MFWHSQKLFQLIDSVSVGLLAPGYSTAYNLRNNGMRGGGVAVFIYIYIYIVETYKFPALEAITVRLILPSKIIQICVVCGAESNTYASTAQCFIDDFISMLFVDFCDRGRDLLILGDISIKQK